MLRNLIGRLFGSFTASGLRASDPARWEAEILERVKEMTPNDPLIGAKVGGKELAARLIEAMKDGRGVHAESLMCAVGALAGYSCQATVRALNRSQGLDEAAHLVVVSMDDGERFFFGDALNKYVAEDELSVWSLAAGGAQACGCAKIPDIEPIFKHAAESIGTKDFGVPRLPEGNPVQDLPGNYLKRLWPQFSPMVERFCPNPEHWPILWGLAIQELFAQTKDVLDPCLSLRVIMESAIPMSKVNLRAA